ncbi:putative bifunctional diguanylate cyclase/phosphodiesterase [Vibrio mexicanus]|uniref:putative bifunctional diguanylate cyclase/phosphodiesterase n=1 Tax=Vibrio mexicanus TaxID=1004326 RepID=UPI00063C7294|nr:diguanylate cyclase [Vibrio mexicanus]
MLIIYSLKAVKEDIKRNQELVVELSQSNKQLFIKLNILVLVTTLCLSLFLSLGLASRLITPLYELIAHSKRLEKGKYGTYNKVSSNDELQELAESINDMDRRLEQRTAEIEFMAFHDSLTKVPNRACFINLIQGLIEELDSEPQSFSILFIDLDGFKSVNDNLGHQAGDNLLCEMSSRINQTIQAFNKDNVVARVGGDEFIVYINQTDSTSDAEDITRQLLKEIHKPINLEQSSGLIYSGASIGISTYDSYTDAQDAEALIKQADIAMYAAKAMGKGCYARYSEELERASKRADELENNLKMAMSDFKQFQVWYQPQVALHDESLVGFEALLRWNHPQLGEISPTEFIPVAESTGLIVDLGKWVFSQVVEDIAKCCNELTFTVSVNVSAKQLRDKGLAHHLQECTAASNVAMNRLQIEITETA